MAAKETSSECASCKNVSFPDMTFTDCNAIKTNQRNQQSSGQPDTKPPVGGRRGDSGFQVTGLIERFFWV